VGEHTFRASGCLLAVVLLAGCGGPIQRDQLKHRVKTLASDAADGSLLARGVAEGRTRSTFVRAHGRELSDDVDHQAEELHDPHADPPRAAKKQQAVAIAESISSALGQLHVAPGDRQPARTAERQLDALAKRANDLADSL